MNTKISVYQLSHKFINRREDVPENAQQVVYYALAVGHHVGVMDCFSTLFEIPYDEYRGWVERLPEGVGRLKLEGIMKWGEIEINRDHVEPLLPLFESHKADSSWISMMVKCLEAMIREPGLYYMMRKLV